MPRKLKLNPQQSDLLVMLEEAGAEDLPTIVASIDPNDIQAFEDNVRGLLRLGLIEFYRDLDHQNLHYIALSQSEIHNLPTFQKILNQYKPEKMSGIMLTNFGNVSLTT